jgi:hypothetical protein
MFLKIKKFFTNHSIIKKMLTFIRLGERRQRLIYRCNFVGKKRAIYAIRIQRVWRRYYHSKNRGWVIVVMKDRK